MSEYEPSTYGDRWAEIYDAWFAGDPGPAVACLKRLAGDGPVLELGIGTGRVALPLAAEGVQVHGVDASAAMIEKLRAKPGGDAIPVAVGDFADLPVDGEYSLVYVVFNTFFAPLTQDEQVRCFDGVARHLAPGGRFLLECFVPDLGRFDRGQRLAVADLDDGEMRLEAAVHDPVRQRVKAQVVRMAEEGLRFFPLEVRYCWPSELDLMARLAGLELENRWGGWREEPFDASSPFHVSVYRKPA